MASCLCCEAALPSVDVEIGETLFCEECGAEHEVLAEAPLELALVEDDDDADVVPRKAPVEDDDPEEGVEDQDDAC